MKPELGASFLAAALLHALVLFGFRMETPARPLAMSEEPAPVDVSLVETAPEPPAPAATPAEPASTPEPPEPQPTPETPAPEQMPAPTPEPQPAPEEETMPAPETKPAPEHSKPAPRRQEQRRPRPPAPHSAAGSAAALAGAASHGVTSGPLSSHARYLSNPKPDYPEEARRQREQGVVLVNVEVGADGRPDEVSLKRSSGFPMLDEAAVDAVRRWRFDPARAGGLPVSSRVDVPVRFSLAD